MSNFPHDQSRPCRSEKIVTIATLMPSSTVHNSARIVSRLTGLLLRLADPKSHGECRQLHLVSCLAVPPPGSETRG
ncbi:hypothetical protein TIFTF001_027377 [Ficus carica]|uniref:Uncharacterized protein n=1 Tax=Ficus carica TaxID=3494 RepID=A0AA88J057_FICCA|nr:hypothetical protein TIFTF001_027377 [Ficus carica]